MASHTTILTHYYVLGIDASADISEIKRAYREKLLNTHPDKAQSSNRSHALHNVNRIQEAYKVLYDPALRREYDQHLEDDQKRRGFHNYGDGLDEHSLDEFEFFPDNLSYCMECPRCKVQNGFQLTEDALESHITDHDATDDGFQLLIQCFSCSLWLKIHFDIGEGYEDG